MTYYNMALSKVYTGRKLYTYKSNLELNPGSITKVSYGRKPAIGIVINKVKKPTFSVKEIDEFSGLRLPFQSIELMKWMFNFYLDDYGVIASLFLTSNFGKSKSDNAIYEIGNGQTLPEPNKEQRLALIKLSKDYKKILLHGETGSGKTRVFVQKVIDTISSGKSAIILTPEIGLTPQLYQTLLKHTTTPIVVSHSSLTNTQRRKIWYLAESSSDPIIYIGPRSTLFLPINNLGLIVVDECHDNSYKQSQSPRYNALHVASQLANISESAILFSTATPNVDDYYKFVELGYEIIRLTHPAIGKHPHKLHIIDQKNKNSFSKSYLVSDQLINACSAALRSKQQILLFLNRRGSARLIECNNCGFVFECPRCGIPFIFHQDKNIMLCHVCNFSIKPPSNCPTCHSIDLKFSVPGTKSLTSHIEQLFPSSSIARFDTDITKQETLQEQYKKIKAGQIDIIIGTQIISKGLDLPKLSVVGVINADNALNLPDFRSDELFFQQLYQVTGRATRGYMPTNSYIQTKNPDNPSIQVLKDRDWQAYFEQELAKRSKYNYPPYCYLGLIKTKSKNSNSSFAKCSKIAEQLIRVNSLKVLGPSPSFYEKRAGMYYWQLILKSPKRSIIFDSISQLKGDFMFDIDPVSLL